MKDYKKAMDKIKADDEFKKSLKEKLNNFESQPKTKSAPTKLYPIVASVTTAAVLLITISFSKNFLLPLLRFNADEYENAHTGSNDEHDYDKTDSAIGQTITDSNDGTASAGNSSDKDDLISSSDNATIPNNNQSSIFNENSEVTEPSDAPSDADEVSRYDIVTFPGNTFTKGSAGEKLINYDSVIHIVFEGFDKYNIGLRRNEMIFVATHAQSYTFADFLTDYYSVIIGTEGITDIENGIIDSFFGIDSTDERFIDVYLNGELVSNLENTYLSQFKDESEVYLTIRVS